MKTDIERQDFAEKARIHFNHLTQSPYDSNIDYWMETGTINGSFLQALESFVQDYANQPSQSVDVTVAQMMPCGCTSDGNPVHWNEFNAVVQCHKCGSQYIKGATDNQDTFKKIMDKANEIQDLIKGQPTDSKNVRDAAIIVVKEFHFRGVKSKGDATLYTAIEELEQALKK